MTNNPSSHALVIGGSMAGLLAARVLSDHFEQVTLVEREKLASRPVPRQAVPQGNHVHVLLLRGLDVIEALLPDISAELQAAGAVVVNGGRELRWFHGGGFRTRYDSELSFLAMSRPLLECAVAARVRGLANVKVVENARVEGLCSTVGGRVTGVRLRQGGAEETIGADLVVDATGRGSATPRWVEELGCGSVATETIPVRLTYSTCCFRQAEGGPDWRALIITRPAARRTGFMFPVEGGRWLVTLNSVFDEPAPRDRDSFLSFAHSLPAPDLYEAIRHLEPASPIVRYSYAGSLRRHYQRLKSLPEGLIVTGDAACSFNPIYGQGMTVAALQADALGKALAVARRNGAMAPDFSRAWQRENAKITDVAWQGVSIEDFRHAEVAGMRPAALRLLQLYMDRLHRATHRSALVTDQFYRVINFLDHPAALFRPRVLADVMFGVTGTPNGRSRPEAMLEARPTVSRSS